jgi:hypothetical protein
MLVCLMSSTMVGLVTSLGFGAPLTEPSVGIESSSLLIGRVSCADPKMYGINEWSSRPHTPWEPAGSRVYVDMSCLTISRYLKQWVYASTSRSRHLRFHDQEYNLPLNAAALFAVLKMP